MAKPPVLEDECIYIFLKSRGTPGKYHWGLVITSFSSHTPDFYHAVNNETTGDIWKLVVLSSSVAETLLRNSLTIAMYKLCPANIESVDDQSNDAEQFDVEGSESQEEVTWFQAMDEVIRDAVEVGKSPTALGPSHI
ncbi:hypothetical protein K402DRAFT_407050 [Aulographum hederae CBS 113979]|uniref:Uncharacterized protein n=1 Tax=Aulographum hederae CBS 113979 TaxID=1176131 RepID=A0A6G1GQB8_9PEZI|nr:hypothetical protein K402DRAFT_407050 [Aulographum hederae CBS 113979]